MGLIKYKTFEDAREGALQELVARSADHARDYPVDEPDLNRSYYPKGLYRFKSWDEARDSDLQFMIRGASRKEES